MSLLELGFNFKIPLDTQMRVDSWGKQIFFFFLKEKDAKNAKMPKKLFRPAHAVNYCIWKIYKVTYWLEGVLQKKSSNALKGSADIFKNVGIFSEW